MMNYAKYIHVVDLRGVAEIVRDGLCPSRPATFQDMASWLNISEQVPCLPTSICSQDALYSLPYDSGTSH